jgi:hypothetical protein
LPNSSVPPGGCRDSISVGPQILPNRFQFICHPSLWCCLV